MTLSTAYPYREKFLNTLPPAYNSGLVQGVLPPAYAGFNPSQIFEGVNAANGDFFNIIQADKSQFWTGFSPSTAVVNPGDPVRVALSPRCLTEPKVAHLNGSTGTVITTPYDAAYQLTGRRKEVVIFRFNDLDLAIQTVGGRWLTTGNQRSFQIGLNAVGRPIAYSSTDGTAVTSTSITTSIDTVATAGDWVALEYVFVPDNGASGRSLTVRYAILDGPDVDPDAISWAVFGTVTTAGATTVFAGTTAGLSVGGEISGGTLVNGRAGRYLLYDATDTLIADCNPGLYSTGTTFSSGGVTWTLAGQALITGDADVFITPTDVARFPYARVPFTGVKNILAIPGGSSENFSLSPWGQTSGGSASYPGIVAGDYTLSRVNGGVSAPAGVGLDMLTALKISTGYSVRIVIKQGTSTVNRFGIFSSSTSWHFFFDVTWTAGVPATSGSNGLTSSVVYTALGDGAYLAETTFTSQATLVAALQFLIHGDRNAGSGYCYAGYLQVSETAWPYQKVTAAWDVSESGIPSVQCLYNDLTNQTGTIQLPETEYRAIFAGNVGVLADTVTLAGSLTYGPTTYTDGAAGAIAASIGQYWFGLFYTATALPAAQETMVINWFKSQGSP